MDNVLVGGVCCGTVAHNFWRRRGIVSLEGVEGGVLCQFSSHFVERKPQTMSRGWGRGDGFGCDVCSAIFVTWLYLAIKAADPPWGLKYFFKGRKYEGQSEVICQLMTERHADREINA
jgi:hypothetical protein